MPSAVPARSLGPCISDFGKPDGITRSVMPQRHLTRVAGLQALTDESSLGLIAREDERFIERAPRFRRAAQAQRKFADRDMEERITRQAGPVFDAGDFLQA